MARAIVAWGPVAVWAMLTAVVSHQPAIEIPFGAPDWMAHGTSYGLGGGLLMWALGGGTFAGMTGSLILPAVVYGTLFGVSDEFHQWFVPGRTASGADLFADAIGTMVGACAAVAVGAALRQYRAHRPGGYNQR